MHRLWNSLIEQLGLPDQMQYMRLEFEVGKPTVVHCGIVIIEDKEIKIDHRKFEVKDVTE